MSERGEFLMKDTRSLKGDRHPRPGILPSYGADRVAPALDPLDDFTPPGVEAARWRDAVDRSRTLVLEVTASRLISTMRMMDLRRDIDRAVAHARAHPAAAVADLAVVWDSLQRLRRIRPPRPERRDRPPRPPRDLPGPLIVRRALALIPQHREPRAERMCQRDELLDVDAPRRGSGR